ncbi:ATP-binding cassette domain-containing protein [Synechocystis sp. PCC 7338]|nr:polysaccharide ABC transporter ATP-binding protein [Synechocystis sp. PCC 7338]QUS59323.1 ATP-binding cassette domain-containing protein [Synechocystis sp. PCC 7338]
MSDVMIRVENLGKKYIIGHQAEGRSNYVALRDVLADGAKSLVKQFTGRGGQRPTQEEFWALKDVSFEVKRGECVGIIGRNGAGKSTLLKILSRITEPTTGRVELHGRVASLLEVGTGFHPELTGRENIYLNGAILGMSRREIKAKFDEIVDFAEVERFLDTPVKRYSSGMYVRLAFAVAAHLEPEILVVDEVLAVGDAAFQKKCLGKMGDVATKEGRTVLFVSHNMSTIKLLCRQSILLDKGKVCLYDDSVATVRTYLKDVDKNTSQNARLPRRFTPNHPFGIEKVTIKGTHGISITEIGGFVEIDIKYYSNVTYDDSVVVGFGIHQPNGNMISCYYSDYDSIYLKPQKKSGFIICKLQNFLVSSGRYYFRFRCLVNQVETDFPSDYLAYLDVLDSSYYKGNTHQHGGVGIVPVKANWLVDDIYEHLNMIA